MLGKSLRLIRLLFVGIWFAIANVVCVFLFIFKYGNTDNNRFFCKVLALPVIKILGLNVEVRLESNLEKSSPCVFLANHQAGLDIITHGFIFPHRTVIIGKKSLAYIPVFGWILAMGGNLLIDRSNSKNAIGKMKTAGVALKKDKTSLWIFPEGTRSYKNGLGKFKKGAFFCAIENNVNLVPVVASSYYKTVQFNRWHSGKVIVQVLQPISTQSYSIGNLEPLMELTEKTMRDAIAQLDDEIAKASRVTGAKPT